MKRALFTVGLLGFAALVMAADRPGNEFDMLTRLNGQEVRWALPDGGASGMSGSGIQCMDVRTMPAAALRTVEVMPLMPINLCYVNVAGVGAALWDGGCGLNSNDISAGVPLQPLVPKYVLLKSTTTHLCQVSDAGTAVSIVYSMQ